MAAPQRRGNNAVLQQQLKKLEDRVEGLENRMDLKTRAVQAIHQELHEATDRQVDEPQAQQKAQDLSNNKWGFPTAEARQRLRDCVTLDGLVDWVRKDRSGAFVVTLRRGERPSSSTITSAQKSTGGPMWSLVWRTLSKEYRFTLTAAPRPVPEQKARTKEMVREARVTRVAVYSPVVLSVTGQDVFFLRTLGSFSGLTPFYRGCCSFLPRFFGGSYPSTDSRLHASLICYFRYWIVNVLGPLTYTKHDTYLY